MCPVSIGAASSLILLWSPPNCSALLCVRLHPTGIIDTKQSPEAVHVTAWTLIDFQSSWILHQCSRKLKLKLTLPHFRKRARWKVDSRPRELGIIKCRRILCSPCATGRAGPHYNPINHRATSLNSFPSFYLSAGFFFVLPLTVFFSFMLYTHYLGSLRDGGWWGGCAGRCWTQQSGCCSLSRNFFSFYRKLWRKWRKVEKFPKIPQL